MMASLVKYVLPLVAGGLLVFTIMRVVFPAGESQPAASPPGLATPSTSPYEAAVAGAGIVEPRTENIAVGAPLPGIVKEVVVHVGDQVKAGQRLFALDDRQLQAELKIRQAAVSAAEAELQRLVHLPRPEEVPVAEAQLRETEATLEDRERKLARAKKLVAANATSAEEVETAAYAVEAARAEQERAEAQLKLLRAGAWTYETELAAAAVERAQAEAAEIVTDLDRLQITAPVAGEILQVNVRPGEYVGAPPGEALLVLGNTTELHIRVDIDENDIPRFRPQAPAVATLKGDPQGRIPLAFVRVEPFVIPKRSLTGENTERIDTRVLQVIYRVTADPAPQLYVGQQVDVYVKGTAKPR